MRLHACVNDNVVTKVVELDEESYSLEASSNQAVIDIEDIIPRPEVGWNLQGATLVAGSDLSLDEHDAFQQKSQRLFGQKLLPLAVDKVGARNLKLSRDGTPANVTALASNMASIKMLMEGGALKTVRTLCGMIKPSFPAHEDILDWVSAEITNFLTNNGWN